MNHRCVMYLHTARLASCWRSHSVPRTAYSVLRTPYFVLVALALLLPAFSPSPAAAQSKPSSLDEELMKDLGGNPIDEIDRELFGGKNETPPDKPAGEMQDRLRRELGQAAVAEDENPLLSIARRMNDAGRLLDARRAGEADKLQRQVIDELDRLIRQARKSCKPCAGQNASQTASRTPGGAAKPAVSNSTQPSRSPGERQADRTASAPPKRIEPGQIDELLKGVKAWGDLPTRVREQMLQLPAEEFVEKYETMIEEYYRRLAEEGK